MNTFDRMKQKESSISPEELRRVFSYDRKTGLITWLSCRNTSYNGKVAGTIRTDRWNKSYVMIQFHGGNFFAHRVAWAIVHDEWPADQIDHKNGVGTDNKLKNLRAATNAQNARNKKLKSTNTSGFNGVRWHSIGKKWNARITIDGKEKSLGMFHRFEDAVEARKAADVKHGFRSSGADGL